MYMYIHMHAATGHIVLAVKSENNKLQFTLYMWQVACVYACIHAFMQASRQAVMVISTTLCRSETIYNNQTFSFPLLY